MEIAHIYFGAMIVLMMPLIVVHLICWQVVKRFPDIMPDDKQRHRYMFSELAMALACITMLWYMWILLPWMVSICGTNPVLGIVSHMPWIAATACVLLGKARHLWRLLAQVQVL